MPRATAATARAVKGEQTIRPNPVSSNAASGVKSLLVLFFRKEQGSSFSEEKEAKRLLFLVLRPGT
jgi:hypothetical protein